MFLLFGAFGFGVFGEKGGVQRFHRFALGAEEPLGSLLQSPTQWRRRMRLSVSQTGLSLMGFGKTSVTLYLDGPL